MQAPWAPSIHRNYSRATRLGGEALGCEWVFVALQMIVRGKHLLARVGWCLVDVQILCMDARQEVCIIEAHVNADIGIAVVPACLAITLQHHFQPRSFAPDWRSLRLC